jgi:Tol biopolymer transport system component
MSGDGRVISFVSDGQPFVDPSELSEQWVFVVRDRQRDVTTVTPVAWVTFADLAADGHSAVMYVSGASIPAPEQVVLYDVTTNSAARLAPATQGRDGEFSTGPPAISPDGRYVAFWSSVDGIVPQDQTGASDAFVYDRTAGEIARLDIRGDAVEQQSVGVPDIFLTAIDISADGQIVALDNPPGDSSVFVNSQ